MKRNRIIGLFLCAGLILTSCATTKTVSVNLRQPDETKIEFAETWAYVMQNREEYFNQDLPITDICYFAADMNCYGELIDIPVRSKLETKPGQRVHFVFICDSRSLTHFLIDPQYGLRDKVISEIVEKASSFDGLNLDMELIPARDRELYLEFVRRIREEWFAKGGTDLNGNNKMFTICVPGRVKRVEGEVLPYRELGELADRIFVMAYDEHWSTSEPGPIASSNWCRQIVDFAVTQMPAEKVIMGMPFYGRTWVPKSPSGAWIYPTLEQLLEENKIESFGYEDDIPTFKYTAKVPVTGYFNDSWALTQLSKMYKEAGIQNIGFWRVGQEDEKFWNYLSVPEYDGKYEGTEGTDLEFTEE